MSVLIARASLCKKTKDFLCSAYSGDKAGIYEDAQPPLQEDRQIFFVQETGNI